LLLTGFVRHGLPANCDLRPANFGHVRVACSSSRILPRVAAPPRPKANTAHDRKEKAAANSNIDDRRSITIAIHLTGLQSSECRKRTAVGLHASAKNHHHPDGVNGRAARSSASRAAEPVAQVHRKGGSFSLSVTRQCSFGTWYRSRLGRPNDLLLSAPFRNRICIVWKQSRFPVRSLPPCLRSTPYPRSGPAHTAHAAHTAHTARAAHTALVSRQRHPALPGRAPDLHSVLTQPRSRDLRPGTTHIAET
jgi:hypothetical protein